MKGMIDLKISYKKIRTNIDWGSYLEFESKEELDAFRVFTILWNRQSSMPAGMEAGVTTSDRSAVLPPADFAT